MNNKIIDWLLESEPWTEYRTRIDLLQHSASDNEVIKAKEKLLKHQNIKNLISEFSQWNSAVLSSHKNAGLLMHKLVFLADIGFNHSDEKIPQIISKIFEYTSEDGVFQSLMNIPTHFGGTGKDQLAWVLCDAPLIVYALAKMGLQNDENVLKAKNFLMNLHSENGFRCKGSKEIGKFRGPGKKEDPCPYSTLIMLKLLNLFEEDKNSEPAKISAETLLNLWEKSKQLHPYMFYMGTDFKKLKAPLIWYDILNLADTLSNFDFIRNDKIFAEIIETINNKANAEGKFTPESEWKAWKGWDFGQKKIPSSWLTFLIYRINSRVKG